MENVLLYSAKRFMFCFIPVLWYYIASNKSVIWLMDKVEIFFSVQQPKKKNALQTATKKRSR
jgi:hypothetical protein